MPNERPVTAVAVSEDGSGLVSAGFDGVLHLWVLGEECGGGLGTTLRSGQQWQRRLAQPTGAGEVIYTCSMTLAVWSWLGVGLWLGLGLLSWLWTGCAGVRGR